MRAGIVSVWAILLVGCASSQPLSTLATATIPPKTAIPSPVATISPSPNQVIIHKRDGTSVSLAVELADTPESQATGLSGRAALAPDSGMLFVFPAAASIEFWMHDTPLPLSIAFVDQNRRIIDIQEMQPETDVHHVPSAPILYAIEANQGFFARSGVGVGDSIEVGSTVTANSTPVT